MCQPIVFYINFTSIEKKWHLFFLNGCFHFFAMHKKLFSPSHPVGQNWGLLYNYIFMLWAIWGLYFINNLELQLKDIYPFLPLSTTNNWKSNLFPCLWSWFFFGNRSRINNAELFLPVKVIKICKSQIITDKETLDK